MSTKLNLASSSYRQEFYNYVATGVKSEQIKMAIASTDSNAAPLPITVVDRVFSQLLNTGDILSCVTTTQIMPGSRLAKSSFRPTVKWIREGNRAVEGEKAIIGSVMFGLYGIKGTIHLSLEASEHTVQFFEDFLVKKITETIHYEIEGSVINGDGETKPKGLLKADALENNKIVATELNKDVITLAETTLPTAYNNKAVYIMNKDSFLELYNSTDNNDNKLAKIVEGVNGPAYYVMGRKTIIVDHLPSFASAANNEDVVVLYDLSQYAVNFPIDKTMTIKTYEDSDTDDTYLNVFTWLDGMPVLTDSLVIITKG